MTEERPKYWRFFKVTEFNTRSSFSGVGPIISSPHKYEETCEIALTYDLLFNTAVIPDDVKKVIRRLSKTTRDSCFTNETQLVAHVVSELIVPLFGNATLEKRKESLSYAIKGANAKHIGMGNSKTWHGTPDFRINDDLCVVAAAKPSLPCDENETESESVVNFDGKSAIVRAHFDQLAATAVINSFVQFNVFGRHISPTILIDDHNFHVCMYDCKEDILLISDAFCYNSKTRSRFLVNGMSDLWTIVNFANTLKKIPDFLYEYKSGIRDWLVHYNCLKSFQDLKEMNVDLSEIQLRDYSSNAREDNLVVVAWNDQSQHPSFNSPKESQE